jgi:hypothetical protein
MFTVDAPGIFLKPIALPKLFFETTLNFSGFDGSGTLMNNT